ncbi:hypothetical protein MMC25_006507 [Agyrium rufum]|nr:hypothetical protein [Agyrium rufum]
MGKVYGRGKYTRPKFDYSSSPSPAKPLPTKHATTAAIPSKSVDLEIVTVNVREMTDPAARALRQPLQEEGNDSNARKYTATEKKSLRERFVTSEAQLPFEGDHRVEYLVTSPREQISQQHPPKKASTQCNEADSITIIVDDLEALIITTGTEQNVEVCVEKPVKPQRTRRNKAATISKSRIDNVITKHTVSIDDMTSAYLAPLISLSPPIEDFQGWTTERMRFLDITKIGEGSYGEVYRAARRRSASQCSTPEGKDSGPSETVIFKLIPLNAHRGPSSKCFTSIDAAANEMKMLARMSSVPGFVEFRGGCLLRGQMPAELVQEWVQYKDFSGRSVESRDPRSRGAYAKSQLWLAIEMSDAGQDLGTLLKECETEGGEGTNSTKRKIWSVQRTWDIFWQVVCGLAKGEMEAGFEHRDLHEGNICVREDKIMLWSGQVKTKGDAPKSRLGRCKVSIIDYTLSRAELRNGEVVSFDLDQDQELLESPNPLYRQIREVHQDDGWTAFRPETNVLWLFALLKSMLRISSLVRGQQGDDNVGFMLSALNDVVGIATPEKLAKFEAKSAGELLDIAVQRGWINLEEIVL